MSLKTVSYFECTPKGSLKFAADALDKSGFDCELHDTHLMVYFNSRDEFQCIEHLMEDADHNCPYREPSCPDKECHKKIII